MGKFTNLNRIKKQAELTETLANRVIGDIGEHCEARKTRCWYNLPTGTPKKRRYKRTYCACGGNCLRCQKCWMNERSKRT
jgi:hypothetical protein